MEIKNHIKNLLTEMSRGAYEREEAIALSLLTAIAGESIFLLGLPGVGKSMIARRLKMAFKGGRNFEYLMSRFSTPDEIFGPVSISKLKDHDSYERVVDGYLPTADVVFLDEIWKAGPAIQNSLLTVLNEKIYHNGKEDIRLPLKAVISASNELPAEGEGLEAIWDRFLVRYIVKPINDKEKFLTLLCGVAEDCHIPEELKLTTEILSDMKKEINQIDVPKDICETMFSIRKTLINQKKQQDEGLDVTKSDLVEPPYVSDRRWKKVMGILKASAFLNGRNAIDFSDCLLMEHMLWDKDEQINSIKKLVSDAIANSIRHNGMPSIIEKMQSNSYTTPVSEPISPDGVHYVFIVGDEEILINKDDYENLCFTKNSYGMMTSDSKLKITEQPSSLLVRKTKTGLSVNSYSYPLKRSSTLISGTIGEMQKGINEDIDIMQEEMKNLVDANLFTPPYNRLAALRNAFTTMKGQFIRKGY
ncbi:MAG: AAA family ATPase [Bacteroidales bacterium]|nr:AAA family ATPase [Candidatus Physcocola equi]